MEKMVMDKLTTCYKNKKVIITGNTGFKGSWLSVWLIKMGAKVYGISKDIPTRPSMFESLGLVTKMSYFQADIRDYSKMSELINDIKPDFLFHLAAQPIVYASYDDPIETFSTNILGTANILEVLRNSNLSCNTVIITSDKCYDNAEWIWGYRESDRLGGKDPYSASKGAAELIVTSYYQSFFNKPESKIKLVTVRAGNVIGGGDWAANRIVPDCIKAWSEGKSVEIRNPRATRPWQHVLEPLSGYLRCGQVLASNLVGVHGEAFNFGPGSDQNHTVLELLQEVAANISIPDEIKMFDIKPNNNLHEAGLLKLNCDKALQILKWSPSLNFNETAKFTANWYQRSMNNDTELYDYTIQQIEDFIEISTKKNLPWSLE